MTRRCATVLIVMLGCGPERHTPAEGHGGSGGSEGGSTALAASTSTSTSTPDGDIVSVCGDGIADAGMPCFRAVTVALPGHDCWLVDIGDVDGDGAADLVATSGGFIFGGGPAWVDVLRAGDDDDLAVVTSTPIAADILEMQLADLDADGREDLVLGTLFGFLSGDVVIQRYQTLLWFAAGVGEWVGVATPAPESAWQQLQAVGDFVAGASLEIVWLDTDGIAGIMEVADDGVPSALEVDALALSRYVAAIAPIDADGAGVLDLAVVGDDRVQLLYGVGDGSFVPGSEFALADAGKLVVGDVDGDGRSEVLAAMRGAVVVLHADAYGFTEGARIPVSGDEDAWVAALVLSDLDGDAVPDLGVAVENGIRLHRGVGDGTFSDPLDLVSEDVRALAAGDLDGDARDDLALCTANGVVAVLYADP